jgi:hypothetical protein
MTAKSGAGVSGPDLDAILLKRIWLVEVAGLTISAAELAEVRAKIRALIG